MNFLHHGFVVLWSVFRTSDSDKTTMKTVIWWWWFGAKVNSEERKLDRCYPGSERRNQRSVNKTLFFQVLWRLTSGHVRAERTLRIWAGSWSSGLRTPSRRVFLSADPTRYQTSTLQGRKQLGSTLTFSGGKKKSRPTLPYDKSKAERPFFNILNANMLTR